MASKAWDTYQQHHRVLDCAVACTASAALIVSWELDLLGGESATRNVTLFATVAGLSVTLLGFAITSIAILIGLFQAPEFGPLRKSDGYGSIFDDYKFAIMLLAATTLLALGATFAVAAQVESPIIFGVVFAMVGWSSVTMAHAVEILWLAMRTHTRAEQNI